ncbi:MAG: 16S rRNA (guanine(966)-N(2))-methyltransferase RsmD [Ruminococcaceae bacterium]|nr:16S rRNA (guanine(966)-N(2))-methyltransferase RsmD [Oscillospiraceae bacterium]
MRVITGSARGRRLLTLEGNDVRPTTDRTKEAMFSSIQFDIEGTKVLDLFAGSGQLGIEALSRGAASAVFIDKNKQAIEIIKKNLLSTSLAKQAVVLNTDADTYVSTTKEKFSFVFMDPPYAKGFLQKMLPLVERVVAEGGAIICEHPYGEELPEELSSMKIYRSYRYGKTAVTVYR